jgi:hypothetical protein
MLYEKLNTDMQELVDAYAERLLPLSWSRRSDALGQAALPLGEGFDADQARLVGKGFVTAVLERLPEDEVTDAHQAVLFALSLNPFHRASADAFLAAHPEVRELVQRELGDAAGDDDPSDDRGPHGPADA